MHTLIFVVLAVALAGGLILGLPALRRPLLSRPLFAAYRRALPQMSDTEREALDAGSVWWEGQLFSGRPDWSRLLAYPRPQLSAAEQAFIDGPVQTVCAMVDDWDVSQHRYDLSPPVWDYLKAQGFLGMIIPRCYGGLEFSAYAHSEVVTRLSTRSSALAVSVMVPNSLGPAELLLHYGTPEQKQYYLPRLARGEDIPAFALTSPWAGSDAASIPDYGVVCKGMWQGREVIGMRVTWDKRYITLAPVCTLLGLAFRLYDPERLLGGTEERGITCALVPRDHPGVRIGRRHFPLNAMFMNGPTQGDAVFMPLDFIIGGPDMIGQGWRMLMECLAAGRSISLPSSNTGMAQLTARSVGAYARVRQQFRTAVGRFEGVEEALARIAGNTYLMDAARRMTAGAVDLGERPSVVSAIVKYHVTERARRVVNDGMDVIGGKGICLGPSNFLGRAYQQVPIGITVEGANILTRSLIIFGQGALRCHPWLLAEMQAAGESNAARALKAFDGALWGHVRHVARNAVRACAIGLSGARLASTPARCDAGTREYFQRLGHLSAAFALISDLALALLGGSLKRREKISARLGDVLSELYLCSTALKRFHDEGCPADDQAVLQWALQDSLQRAQAAIVGVCDNFPSPLLGWLLQRVVFPWGLPCSAPSDALGHTVAEVLLSPSATRDRLTAACVITPGDDEALATLEQALSTSIACEALEARLRGLEKHGELRGNPLANVRDLARAAFQNGMLDAAEFEQLRHRNTLRDRVIRVDDFPSDFSAERPAATTGRPDLAVQELETV